MLAAYTTLQERRLSANISGRAYLHRIASAKSSCIRPYRCQAPFLRTLCLEHLQPSLRLQYKRHLEFSEMLHLLLPALCQNR